MTKNTTNQNGQVGVGAELPGVNVENIQLPLNNDGNGQVGPNYVQVLLMALPAVPPENADMIIASAAGGMFSLQAVDQFVTLTAEPRSQFTACFIKKMLQDEAIKKAQEDVAAKHNQLTKDNLRKNEIRLQKDKMKVST